MDETLKKSIELIMKAIRESGQDKQVLLKQLKKSNRALLGKKVA